MHPVPWPHPQVVRMSGQDAEAEKNDVFFYFPALANTPVPENKNFAVAVMPLGRMQNPAACCCCCCCC